MQLANLCLKEVFLATSTKIEPVTKSKTPITTKSDALQMTAVVSCITASGMSKRTPTAKAIQTKILLRAISRLLVVFIILPIEHLSCTSYLHTKQHFTYLTKAPQQPTF